MKTTVLSSLLWLSLLLQVQSFLLRKEIKEEQYCRELFQGHESSKLSIADFLTVSSQKEIKSIKHCFNLLEKQKELEKLSFPRALQWGGGGFGDDNGDDDEQDPEEEEDAGDEEISVSNADGNAVVGVASVFGIFALASVLFVFRKRKAECATCLSNTKIQFANAQDKEVRELSTSPGSNEYSIIPIPHVPSLRIKGKKRNSKANSSRSSGRSRAMSKLLQSQSKRDLLEYQQTINRKIIVENRSDMSQVLADISSLALSPTNPIKPIPIKPTNGKGGVFGRFTVQTAHEERVKFLNERIHWQNYRTSIELTRVRKEVVDAIVGRLDRVTIQEEDIEILKNSAYLDIYEGISIPDIPLKEYLVGLVDVLDKFHQEAPFSKNDGNGVGIRCLVMSVIYINRIKVIEENFFLSVFNHHRIFAICMFLAVKITEDKAIENKNWAETSGVYVDDLNEVELDFCKAIRWDLLATEDDIDLVYREFGLKELVTFIRKETIMIRVVSHSTLNSSISRAGSTGTEVGFSAKHGIELQVIKDCLYLLEEEERQGIIPIERILQRGGRRSDDDDEDDDDDDDDEDSDSEDEEDGTTTIAIAAGAGVLTVGSLVLLTRKRKIVCATCYTGNKTKEPKSETIEAKELPSAARSIEYSVIPIPYVPGFHPKVDKRNSNEYSSSSSGHTHPQSRLFRSQSKRKLLQYQGSLSRKVVVDDRSEMSQVLSLITSLRFVNKPPRKIIQKKISNGKGAAFGRFTVPTVNEERVDFFLKRTMWKTYEDSIELSKVRDDVVNTIVDILAKVTIQEEDLGILQNSAYLDIYEGISIPKIPLNEYLFCLVHVLDNLEEKKSNSKYGGRGVGIRCLVMSVIYINRIKVIEENFFLSVFNQHRIFAICMFLAVKITEDKRIDVGDWAEVSGLYVEELSEVEMTFSKAIRWDLLATEDEIDQVYREFGLNDLLS
eukprot:augustus_masked-scaffold_49-processed-gene-1.17-mRNA-1 protein AED:1.00 eAED:1.00 QI:0/0/0/0/1/1/3/0/948